MKGRLPLFVILGSSLAFLASLSMPWVDTNPDSLERLFSSGRHDAGALSLLNLFSGSASRSFPDGWNSFGQAAAIAAVALALCALVSLVRPELEGRLPLGGCAIAIATLALVNAATAFSATAAAPGFHVGSGAYVGGAAALVALLSAAWVSHDDVSELTNAAAATLLTIGLVGAYVLLVRNAPGYLPFGGASYGTAIMLLIASFGLTFWFGIGRPLRRVSAAAVVLVLVVGGFSVLGTHMHWPYEAWLAIGCAAGLLALAVASSRERLTLGRADAVALTGATVLLASFFFNWQGSCGPRCFVSNGWSGGLKGGLVAIFVVLLLGFRYLSPELAVTVAIYVLGAGLEYTAHGSLGYGAYLGFAGTALLLVAVGLQPRMPARGGFRLIPIAACVVLLAIPAATLTERLPTNLEIDSPWRLVLLGAAAIVVGLRLIGRWLCGPADDDELVLLPLALLAFVGLNLRETHDAFFISWEGWLSLALCLLLVALGWIDRYRGGLNRWRIPDEIWRVDRISAGEN